MKKSSMYRNTKNAAPDHILNNETYAGIFRVNIDENFYNGRLEVGNFPKLQKPVEKT